MKIAIIVVGEHGRSILKNNSPLGHNNFITVNERPYIQIKDEYSRVL